MKLNKWTVGLAALGVVSLASAVKAEESGNAMMTALSSTTFSGYVDTSMHWNLGTGNEFAPPYKFNSGKADGFNLDVVQLTIAKPLDENEWAAGYHADLWFGPDANVLGTTSTGESADIAIRQAYVALRMPIGNGLDWKIGVFDSIVGYESVAAPNNPNYTRSYGHSIEPQTHTGVLASYRFCDAVSMSVGIANTVGSTINGRANPPKAESYKTYMASLALTAPDNWGFLAGSTLYGGWVNGYSSSVGDNLTHYYAGATLATPVTGLRFGASFDLRHLHSKSSDTGHKETWAAAGYASYQATEKLSLHFRGEFVRDSAAALGLGRTVEVTTDIDGDVTDVTSGIEGASRADVLALTATAQYDLWKNVISRLEVRWDHGCNGRFFGGARDITGISKTGGDTVTEFGGSKKNEVLIAANIIYKF